MPISKASFWMLVLKWQSGQSGLMLIMPGDKSQRRWGLTYFSLALRILKSQWYISSFFSKPSVQRQNILWEHVSFLWHNCRLTLLLKSNYQLRFSRITGNILSLKGKTMKHLIKIIIHNKKQKMIPSWQFLLKLIFFCF